MDSEWYTNGKIESNHSKTETAIVVIALVCVVGVFAMVGNKLGLSW